MHVDKNGNSYLAGLSSLDNNDPFTVSALLKIDPSGNVLWRKELALISAASSNFLFINSLATDSLENIYLTGQYYGSDISNSDSDSYRNLNNEISDLLPSVVRKFGSSISDFEYCIFLCMLRAFACKILPISFLTTEATKFFHRGHRVFKF